MNKQRGFTLIELVTVIIIIGILAAFALPRFVNLTNDARAASVKGLGGSVRAAAALAHAAYMAKGTTPGAVTMDGVSVALTNGYPAASTNGIAKALQDTSGFSTGNSGGTYKFWLTRDAAALASAPGDCDVEYQAAASGASPTITVNDGCG